MIEIAKKFGPTAFTVFYTLNQVGEISKADLIPFLRMDKATILKALRKLLAENLIEKERKLVYNEKGQAFYTFTYNVKKEANEK